MPELMDKTETGFELEGKTYTHCKTQIINNSQLRYLDWRLERLDARLIPGLEPHFRYLTYHS